MVKKKTWIIIVGALIVLFVVITLVASLFGGKKDNTTTSSVSNPTGQAKTNYTQNIPAGASAESLNLRGAISGTMSQGRQGDNFTCTATSTGPIEGDIGGTEYAFNFRSFNNKGTGVFSDVYVSLGAVGSNDIYYASTGTVVTIDKSGSSGTVSADLVNINDATHTVHLSGTWICPPVGS